MTPADELRQAADVLERRSDMDLLGHLLTQEERERYAKLAAPLVAWLRMTVQDVEANDLLVGHFPALGFARMVNTGQPTDG